MLLLQQTLLQGSEKVECCGECCSFIAANAIKIVGGATIIIAMDASTT
jgi:hypothetical protein